MPSKDSLLLGQTGKKEPDKKTAKKQDWPKKKSYRYTWEKIISFPGELIFLPVKLILNGTGETIAFIDRTKLIPKTKDFLKSDDGRRALLPTYSSRSGAGIKIYQKGLLNPESKLTAAAAFGIRNRQDYQLEFKRIKMLRGLTAFLIRYQFLSDEAFYGTGPDSKFDNESNYAYKRASAEINYGKQFTSKFLLDVLMEFSLNDILKGKNTRLPFTTELYTDEELPGLDEQVRLSSLQLTMQYDSKNRMGNPSAGYEALLMGGVFQDLKNDRYKFWKASADFTKYIHLFYDRILVLRVAGEMVAPFSDGLIPFYCLSELGRRETIRGFQRGRYQDNDMVLGAVEYRYPLLQKKESGIDALLFVDGGQVSPNIFKDFAKESFKVGVGGGIRVYGAEGLTAKVELGKSRDGWRFYFVLN